MRFLSQRTTSAKREGDTAMWVDAYTKDRGDVPSSDGSLR